MRNTERIWLIAAASLVLIGCIIMGGVLTMINWDFKKLSTAKYETNEYSISEEFNNISVESDTADLIFALSEDGTCKVECYEDAKEKHTVTVEEDTLIIKEVSKKAWYDHIRINFSSPKITLYLPKTEYTSLLISQSTGDIDIPKDFRFNNIDISLSTGNVDLYASASEMIKIQASTGDIFIENISAGALDLSVSTGRVTAAGVNCEGELTVGVSTGKAYLNDIECKSVISSGDTGDISLNNVIATEKFSIERSTGVVKFEGCDAAEIFIKTDTGDVIGTLLSDKVFITDTDTGRISVPNSVTGGRCEVTTDTGNIIINIAN